MTVMLHRNERGDMPARRVFAETAREFALARHVRVRFSRSSEPVCVGPSVGDAGIEPASAASETTCRPSNPQCAERESNSRRVVKSHLLDLRATGARGLWDARGSNPARAA
jgi:hypothetical protein